MNARGNIDRFRATAVIKDSLTEVSFYRSVACGRIQQDHERFSDDPQGKKMIF